MNQKRIFEKLINAKHSHFAISENQYLSLYHALSKKTSRIKRKYPECEFIIESYFREIPKYFSDLNDYNLDQIANLLGRDIDIFFKIQIESLYEKEINNPQKDKSLNSIKYNDQIVPILRYNNKIILLNPTPVKKLPKIKIIKLSKDDFFEEEIFRGSVQSWKDLNISTYDKHRPKTKNSHGSKYLSLDAITEIETKTFISGKGFLYSENQTERLFLYHAFDDFVGEIKKKKTKTKFHKLIVDRVRENNTTRLYCHGYPISEQEFKEEFSNKF
jgi:hypothetical protein